VRNLELKVRCSNEEALDALIARARAAGAVYVRTMGQRDVYCRVPRGRLKLRQWWLDGDQARGGERVVARPSEQWGQQDAGSGVRNRVRENGDVGQAGAVLSAYARPDDAGSRFSDYLLSPVTESATMRAVLAHALGERVVVEKRRVFYRYGQTRIHFDHVATLGAFVELETLMDEATEAAAVAEHHRVIDRLGLDTLPIVAGSYSDLLEGKDTGGACPI
jgi:adenylate cyclase class IV